MTSRNGLIMGTTGLTRRVFNAGLASSALLPLATPVLAQTPKRGGRLKAAFDTGGPKDTLDPSKAVTAMDIGRSILLHNRLVEVDSELALRPGLAESWEANSDATEWTLALRKGVEFHDGRSFTAKDVLWTIRRVLDPATVSSARSLIADIDGDALRADGDHTVRIKLKAPNADLPMLLYLFQMQIVPDGHIDFTKPVGTGPFKFKEFTPGINAVFERNPNYWRADAPLLDEVETIAIPDGVARVNALLAGEVHLVNKFDPKLMDRLKDDPSAQVISTPSPAHVTFPMRADTAPFTDPNVRNALKLLVEREKFVQIAYNGQGVVANDHPIPPFDPFYCSELPIRPYDPEQAKFLLNKAGLGGTTFELFTSDAPFGGVTAALVYAEMATKAGVNVKVVRSPNDGYYDEVYMKKPWCVSFWYGRPTADLMFATAYSSTAKWNESFWQRPAFDALLVEGRKTTDFAKRKQIYWDAQKMLHDDGSVVIPCFTNWLDGQASSVRGLTPHPLGAMGWFNWENVWLDQA